MNILVCCPLNEEFKAFNDTLKKVQSSMALHHRYDTLQIGVGKVNAASNVAIQLYSPFAKYQYDLIAVVGTAAASSYYKQGDIVIPSYAKYTDTSVPEGMFEELSKTYDLEGNDECTVLTSDRFITQSLASKIIAKYGDKVLFDMESTAVCQVAQDLSIPVIVIKYISDTPDSQSENLQSFLEFLESHSDYTPIIGYLESM